MSILIKGMEIPKTCCQCDLKIYDPEKRWDENGVEQIGAWVCKRTRELVWNTKRGENCPINEIKAPHGRLIDADALNKSGTDIIDYYAGGFGTDGSMKEIRGFSKQKIERASTIIEAEGGVEDG